MSQTPKDESVTLVAYKPIWNLNSRLISGRYFSSMIKGPAVAYFVANYEDSQVGNQASKPRLKFRTSQTQGGNSTAAAQVNFRKK
jgi:hypothetical protein